MAEGLHRGPPREGGVGEVGSDLLDQAAVLGAVGDDQVVAGLGVVAQGHARVLNDEGARRDGDLAEQPRGLHAVQGVDDGLAEGQIVLRAGSHHRSPQRLRPRRLGVGLGRGGGSSLLGCGGSSFGFGRGGGGSFGGCGGLGLGRFQLRLQLGDDLRVDCPGGRIHGRRQCLLGLGRGGGSLLGPGGGLLGLGRGRVGLGLGGGRVGLGLSGGCLGLGLGRGRVAVDGVVIVSA